MMTFQSSGTPIGTCDRMNRWNAVITTSVTQVTGPPSDRTNTSGNRYSSAFPKWASRVATADGRRSSGNERYIIRFQNGGLNGLLLTITHITAGKCALIFEVAAHHQIASHTTLAPASQSGNSRQIATDR